MHARVLTLIAMLLASTAHAQSADTPRKIAISAGSLVEALDKLTVQSGVQIMYEPKMAEGFQVAALNGTLTVKDALAQLLAKTGLRADTVNERTVVLKKADRISQLTLSEVPSPREVTKETPVGNSEVRDQVLVRGKNDRKPYTDANVDLPRTMNDAQPYYIFDSETIERAGVANIEDFLKQRLTMNTSAGTLSQDGSNGSFYLMGNGNVSRINLRGLGFDKTLILVNGRRRAGVIDGEESLRQTDLNGIPLNAVDRIEVLPTSASGIYGGSAIGGVINVILKKNYTGGDLGVNYDSPMDNDAPRRTVSGLYGFALEGGRTNVTLSGSWSDSKAMVLRDRREVYEKNLATVLRNNPALVYPDRGTPEPRLGATTNVVGWVLVNGAFQAGDLILKTNMEPLGTPYTYFDPGISSTTPRSELDASLRRNRGSYNLEMAQTAQQFGLLQPLGIDTQVRSFQATADRKMLSWLDAYAEVSYSENAGQGTEVNPGFVGLGVFASNANNPFARRLSIALPMPPDGNPDHDRNVNTEYANTQVVLGLQARLPWDWTGQLDYQWSENKQSAFYNDIDITEFVLRVSRLQINPFVDTMRYPLNIDDLWYPQAYRGKNSLSTVSLRGSGRLFSLPWGVTRLTVGLEHRSAHTPAQTYGRRLPFSTTSDNDTYYYPKNQTEDSLYAEIDVPLVAPSRHRFLHSLSVQLAGRADRSEVDAGTSYIQYSYFTQPPQISYGGLTLNDQPYFTRETYESANHTFGLKYQPLSWVTLRASGATAFLPVPPSQLQRDPLTFQRTVDDPVNGPTPDVTILGGGNPDLKPQDSRSFNAGLILEPEFFRLKGMRLNLEYYSIEQFNAVGSLDDAQLLTQESTFPGRVVRNASGVITQLDLSLVNLYKRETTGLDVNLSYAFTAAGGQFNLQAAESFIQHLKTQYSQSEPPYDAAGFSPPKHKRNATLSWSKESLTIGWAVAYVGSYKQYGAAGSPISVRVENGGVFHGFGGLGGYDDYITAQGSDAIASQAYHDIYMHYRFESRGASPGSRWFSGLDVSAGVKNVFDKAPPFDAINASLFYTNGYGDLRLRNYWLGLKKSF